MTNIRPLFVLCALAFAAAGDVHAAPGDVYVPAHRTRDGHYVPPNVPPHSGPTRLARRPAGARPSSVASNGKARTKLAPPLLVDAREVRH